MANPPVPRPSPGITRVAFSGTFASAKWANVMHVNVPSSGSHTQAAADSLANSLHTFFGQAFAPVSNVNWVLEETNIVMFTGPTTVLEAVGTGAVTGQDSGSVLSAGTAIVISWKTSAYYRGGHPRTYLCGVTQDRLASATQWSAQTIQDYSGAAVGFRGAINGTTLPGGSTVTLGYLQVYPPKGSTSVPKVYLDPPIFHPFVSSSVHPRVDSQRRRLGRESST